jgi:PAS domain S-box-containing protein
MRFHGQSNGCMSSPASPVESGAILHALAGAVPDVLVVLDRDGRYVDVMSRRSDLPVTPAAELRGRSLAGVFPPPTAEVFTRWIHHVLDTGHRAEKEYEVEIDGRPTWFGASLAPLSASTVLWIARDITGRKALEAQVQTPARTEAADRVPAGIPSKAIPVQRGDARVAEHARPGTIVLLVEDEPQVRGAASRVLRRYGYTVLEAQNGLEGLGLWSERGHEIGLIVSDVVMPQLGGREMVRRLRGEGATVPILFISGYAQGATPERLDDSGRSAFLAKPFDIGVFVRMAAELIQGAPSRHAGLTPAPPRTGE